MNLENPNSSNLSNALHFQYATEAKGVVEKFNAEALNVVSLFNEFLAALEREDLCYKVVRKSDITEAKENADQARDSVLKGLAETIRGAVRHFNPEVKEAARKLKIVIDDFNHPKPLAKLPYDAETAAVTNLLQEFTGKYAAEVELTGLAPWVAELESRNNEFDRLSKDFTVQNAAKPPYRMSTVRKEVDDALLKLTKVLNADILRNGEEAYAPLAAEWNALTKHYADLLAQHLGRNKAKKKEKI